MDKYEYRVKTEQMLEYMEKKQYKKAMEIADTIDWRRVKSSTMLSTVSEIYECNGENQKSRDVLFIAYDRSPGSRKIVYRLGTLAVKLNDLQEAMDCYDEFIALAPKDPNQFILKYKIFKAQGAPKEQQIEALIDFKKVEYVEKWAYELAKLYHEAGLITECLEECDDLILWFSEGKYVLQAMKLKMQHKPLTPLQQEKYKHCIEEQTRPKFKRPEKVEQPEEPQEPQEVAEEKPVENNLDKTIRIDFPEVPVEEPVKKEKLIKQTIVGATLEEALAKGVAAATRVEIPEEKEEPVVEEEPEVVEEPVVEEEPEVVEEPVMEEEPEVVEEPVMEEEPEVVEEPVVEEEPEVVEESVVEEEPEVVEEPVVEEEPEVVEEPVVEEEPVVVEEPVVEEPKTAQEKIEGILQDWEEKQRAVEREIEEKRQQAEAEKAEREAKRKEMAEQNMFNTMPIIPDDIQKLLEDLENGILDSDDDNEPRKAIDNTEKYEEVVEFEEPVMEEEPEVIEEPVVEEEPEMVEELVMEEEPEMVEEPVMEEEFEINSNFAETFAEMFEEDFAEDFEEEEFVEEFEQAEDFAEDDDIIAEEYDIQVPEFEEEPVVEEPVVEEPKTALEQLEEIESENQKPMAPGSFDTGFIVQGRYDLEAQSEIGLKAGLTEEQKKLFSYFVPVRGMSEQIVEVLDHDKECKTRYGTSRTGNILVVGRQGTGKTVLAVNVVKAIQKARRQKHGKVAIVTGDALNKKELSSIIGKLRGGAIIIEKAGMMNARTIQELNDLMEEQTGELLVVLEEQRKPLEKMLAINLDFKRKFTSKLELPIFINDELVTFGQTYAKENGYKIDEMGILALYSRIDLLQKEDHAVTVSEVKDIIDDAIENAQKANVKHFMKRVFGKRTDNADRVILTEQDFK